MVVLATVLFKFSEWSILLYSENVAIKEEEVINLHKSEEKKEVFEVHERRV